MGPLLRLIEMWLPLRWCNRAGKARRQNQRSDQRQKGTPQEESSRRCWRTSTCTGSTKRFTRPRTGCWAKRPAGFGTRNDFVVLARYQDGQLRGFIEDKLEKWLGLGNQTGTRRGTYLYESKKSLDFPGLNTFRYVNRTASTGTQ